MTTQINTTTANAGSVITISTAAETVAITSGVVSSPFAGGRSHIYGVLNVTLGATITNIGVRCRRQSLTGTSVATQLNYTESLVSGSVRAIPFDFTENAPELASAVYVITLTMTGQSSASFIATDSDITVAIGN